MGVIGQTSLTPVIAYIIHAKSEPHHPLTHSTPQLHHHHTESSGLLPITTCTSTHSSLPSIACRAHHSYVKHDGINDGKHHGLANPWLAWQIHPQPPHYTTQPPIVTSQFDPPGLYYHLPRTKTFRCFSTLRFLRSGVYCHT